MIVPQSSTSPNTARLGRVFGLDFVRATAIVLVLAAHYGVLVPAWLGYPPKIPLPGLDVQGPAAALGVVGVELFFVLSGFLIGRLLLDVVRLAPSFTNLRIFLVRRWMRTVPLYGAWLCISLILFPPPDHPLRHFVSYLTFSQNLAWAMPASGWFGVSWSLTAEEWFYLLFSTCAVGLAMIRKGGAAMLISLALVCIVPAVLRWNIPDTVSWDETVRKITILKLDAIGYGVTLACLRNACPRLFAYPRFCVTIGAALAVMVWACFSTGTLIVPYHVFRTFSLSVAYIGFALCIIGASSWVQSDGWFARVIRKISDISFGLYVVHLTILVAAGQWLTYGIIPVVTGAITVTVALALLSWHCLESPILRLRPRQTFATVAGYRADGNLALGSLTTAAD